MSTKTSTNTDASEKGLFAKIRRSVLESAHDIHFNALGFAWGMFWALTPTFMLQTLIISVQYVVFRFFANVVPALKPIVFNAPVAILLSYICNPITVVPMFTIFYLAGEQVILATDSAALLAYDPSIAIADRMHALTAVDSFGAFWEWMQPVMGPIWLGALSIAIPAGLVTYFVAYRFVAKAVAKTKSA